MGLFDNVTSAVNRGTESAGRAAEKMRLKTQINEINKRRQQLAAQLGATLYDATKDDPQYRSGREALYDGIGACDAERAAAQAKIDELDAMAQAATAAATTYRCVVCGAAMAGDDLFCSGCGTPADQARPVAAATSAPLTGPRCAQCDAPMAEGDMFCMACGARVQEGIVEETVVQEQPVESLQATLDQTAGYQAESQGGER